MRIVTYRSDGGERAGVQVEGGTIDAAELLGAESASVREPRVWLKAGDEIVINSPQLGTLATRIT